MDALRRALAAVYREMRDAAPFASAALTGHSHLDLVWLWTEQIGEGKAVHTFANANRLMALYPEFRFAYSQSASYEAVGRRSPELHRAVKARLRSGQWEATGGMYVESDSHVPCGEGLARAFMIGQESFKKLTGKPIARALAARLVRFQRVPAAADAAERRGLFLHDQDDVEHHQPLSPLELRLARRRRTRGRQPRDAGRAVQQHGLRRAAPHHRPPESAGRHSRRSPDAEWLR